MGAGRARSGAGPQPCVLVSLILTSLSALLVLSIGFPLSILRTVSCLPPPLLQTTLFLDYQEVLLGVYPSPSCFDLFWREGQKWPKILGSGVVLSCMPT